MSVSTLPDVVSDHVTDAAKRLGVQFIELVFIKAAKIANHGSPLDSGRALHRVWNRHGYEGLPRDIKDAILEINNGEHREEVVTH